MRFPLAWGVLILGNSVLEGFGSALLIPPVYILTTLLFTNLTSRARAFGRISGMGGIGAATGPLIGGLITTAISWRAAFLFWFFLHIRARERAGKEPLVSTSLFRSRTSNLGLVTQNIQWLLLIGPGLGVMLTPRSTWCSPPSPGTSKGRSRGCRAASHLGLVAGHRHRRHHPGVRPGIGEPVLRPGDGLLGRDRAHRPGGCHMAPSNPVPQQT